MARCKHKRVNVVRYWTDSQTGWGACHRCKRTMVMLCCWRGWIPWVGDPSWAELTAPAPPAEPTPAIPGLVDPHF